MRPNDRYSYLLLIAIISVTFLCPAIGKAGSPLPPEAKFEIGFSPNGDAQELILSAIKQSKKSILVAAYSFTSKPIALALRDAHKRGVEVKIIADQKGNSTKYSAVTFMANQGVPIRVNGNYQIFHHKFMVIDGKHLETGSFNYSNAAQTKNSENVLILWDVEDIAKIYTQKWEQLWNESTEVAPQY